MELSGAVNGKAEWPLNLKPVAWHRDAEMARMKLGLYHARDHVADGEVEYRDISIEGPRGIIRTTPESSVKQARAGLPPLETQWYQPCRMCIFPLQLLHTFVLELDGHIVAHSTS